MKHAGTAPRAPPFLLLHPLPPSYPKPRLSRSFVPFSRHGEKERTNGQVGYTKHIRLYGTSANWPASFLLFFPRFLLQPGDINPYFSVPLFEDEEDVERIVARARRAWSGRVESPREIEPSKKFRNRALNSGCLLPLCLS